LQPSFPPFLEQSTIYYSERLTNFPVSRAAAPSSPAIVEKAQQEPH